MSFAKVFALPSKSKIVSPFADTRASATPGETRVKAQSTFFVDFLFLFDGKKDTHNLSRREHSTGEMQFL